MPDYTHRVIETAEAVNAALHDLGWTHLGDSHAGRMEWWARGVSPQILRICVEKALNYSHVLIALDWPNVSLPGRVVRGQQALQIDVRGKRADVELATEAVVTRCLVVYRDIVGATGVAGREAALTATRN